MFPELNNQKIFEILCLNNNTRVIYMNNDKDDAIYNFYLKRDTVKIAKNINIITIIQIKLIIKA